MADASADSLALAVRAGRGQGANALALFRWAEVAHVTGRNRAGKAADALGGAGRYPTSEAAEGEWVGLLRAGEGDHENVNEL